MKADPSPLSAFTRSLVVIGNFDGVHLGHQAVLRAARDEAGVRGLAPKVLTFDPHPRAVVGQGAPELLTPMPDRIALIRAAFPEIEVCVEPFTRELSALGPREFVERVLLAKHSAALVLVGQDFRFGRGRAGGLIELTELGKELDFEARAVSLVTDAEGRAYSSSRIRDLLKAGDPRAAARLLGRQYTICGEVIRGDGRGRTIGFPTANLNLGLQLAPGFGVYAGHVRLADGRSRIGVMNHGPRPTLDRPVSTEVHILGLNEDLYGQTLRFDLLDRLRGVQRFNSLEALVRQIGEDVQAARALVGPDDAGGPASGSFGALG